MDEHMLLDFFKALADANRLKIIGLLARESYTVEELAVMLDLRPSTISHHLSRLAKIGLVSARAESYYNVYQLETAALENMARQLLSRETLPVAAADVDLNAYERKIVSDFSNPDGSLKTIPAQRKKLGVILGHIAKTFEPGKRYPEQEANLLLANFHADTATLRRELVGARLLARDRGEYWRTET